jgi:hypothetical protein
MKPTSVWGGMTDDQAGTAEPAIPADVKTMIASLESDIVASVRRSVKDQD